MYIFQKIIQKDNFIDFIDIDTNFNAALYINKIYKLLELENLIENIGYDATGRKKDGSELPIVSEKIRNFISKQGW